jgi:hypothetical protein
MASSLNQSLVCGGHLNISSALPLVGSLVPAERSLSIMTLSCIMAPSDCPLGSRWVIEPLAKTTLRLRLQSKCAYCPMEPELVHSNKRARLQDDYARGLV